MVVTNIVSGSFYLNRVRYIEIATYLPQLFHKIYKILITLLLSKENRTMLKLLCLVHMAGKPTSAASFNLLTLKWCSLLYEILSENCMQPFSSDQIYLIFLPRLLFCYGFLCYLHLTLRGRLASFLQLSSWKKTSGRLF